MGRQTLHNPQYPPLPAVEKYRCKARAAGGLSGLDENEVYEYGAKVLAAIGTLNRAKHAVLIKEHRVNCASGSNTAEGIFKAIYKQNVARLRNITPRTDEELQEAYDKAMEAKRNPKKRSRK